MKDGTGADLSPRKLKASAESLDDRATDPQSYAHSFGLGGEGRPEHAKRITSRMFCSFVSSVLYGPQATVYLPSEPSPSPVPWQRSGTTVPWNEPPFTAPIAGADTPGVRKNSRTLQQSLAVCPHVRP